ncbi:MAG: tyrosine-type recombinase/integrase [Firmicutes bacterium]|nr:tyrosine-type recombinase/integrase [Bacillota bacterium]MDY5041955.1 tyrosine-type recombinase/integrase [Eubacteriales bacterium]
MGNSNYFNQRDEENILKLRELRLELPAFCGQFFMGIENQTMPLTRLGYGRDLKIFFDFLVTNTQEFYGKKVADLTLDDLNKVTSTHLEMFMDYLTVYKVGKKTYRNGLKGKGRKLSSVRALLKYFFKKEKIDNNVGTKVDTPKYRDSEIIRLEVDEVVKLLNMSEDGSGLTTMQKGFHNHTKERDYALLSLFLGTGIRISECVGLNVEDIDFDNNAFTITRKGGSRVILYFGDEVKEALQKWISVRNTINGLSKDEHALFISLQNKRMNVRTVEKLVKKYASVVTPLKHITPHKLRSTYGTNLYRETNDIYVVASVLGHKDVNTTRKHYAAMSEDIRREAATKVKLRKD